MLLTGGAGFLGYYLVQTLLEWNAASAAQAASASTVLDNFVRGVAGVAERPRWLTTRCAWSSTTSPSRCRPISEQFDYIVHAASIASPTYYRQHPIETMDANVNGLRLLLEYACAAAGRRAGRSRASCSSRAARSTAIPSRGASRRRRPTAGNVSCTGPRACYDESKRYGETLCVNFAQQYGLPVTIARPFNNYGPGLKITDRRVIPDFARDILAGRDIVLLSDGSPTRTFCYVADAVVGYYKILVRGRAGRGLQHRRRDAGDLDARAGRAACRARPRAVRLRGPAWCDRRAPTRHYLVDNPHRRCPVIAKARTRARLRAARSVSTKGLRRSLLWYCGQPARRRRRDERLDRRRRVRRAGDRRCAWPTPGHDVTCVDVDAAKVAPSHGGEPPIHEAGLDELLRTHLGHALRATTDLRDGRRAARSSR